MRKERINYQSISILPNRSKIFENVLYAQISYYCENIFSKYQACFRKGFNLESFLVAIVDKSKKSLEQGSEYDALLTDLSKTFSCLPHGLVIEKLHACGFWHSIIKTYA